ncbi:hypothetical protein FQN54_005455 [Arachnomyces sp. PD_36]|nr:hypothetical protein FQN54_005455 [Arachnomyces sp. PD_36]
MHFLKASLISLISLAVAVNSATIPFDEPGRLKFWEDRISTFRQENTLNDAQNKALDSALDIIRNRDDGSYDLLKQTVTNALDFEQAKSLFVPSGDSKGKREVTQSPNGRNVLKARQLPGCEGCPDCVCSSFDGSDCVAPTICHPEPSQDKLCAHYVGGCGWGGLQACDGLCS